MEFSTVGFIFVGLLVGILWSLDFWKIFQKPQLVLPDGRQGKRFRMFRVVVFALGLIGWVLMSVSLGGPRKPLKFMPSDIEVNDIFLVVDVSRSMLAEDLKPNRLEVAKIKLREFAALRPTDRFGIIMFSEKVFTLLPLTTDPQLVDQVLGDIKIGFLGSGTNIGDALALAVARGQKSKTKNKVIVLLTDGVQNYGSMTPIKAAHTAKEFNMKVYTIGLGKVKAKLPIGRDAMGNRHFQNIPGGSIDIKTLKEISKITGGKNFMAGSENSLKEILEEIQKLEKTKIKSQGQIIYDELYYMYLLWGLLLWGISEALRRFVLREVV